MREFLFRGKTDYLDVRNKWKYGYYVHEENDFIGYYNKNHCLFCYDLIDIKTLGQYTGIKDKNGKKIFEGDIIKLYDEYWYISFNYGTFLLTKNSGRCIGISLWPLKDLEVLGNIYDNPELLKEPENNENTK